MKRPQIIHFLTLISNDFISLRASIGLSKKEIFFEDRNLESPSFPIQSFGLLNSTAFHIKIIGLDKNKKSVFNKIYESDSFGGLNFKIPLTKETKKITIFQAFETKTLPGIEIHLGSFIPLVLKIPKKIIICDFDKTLVDTKYSTTKDVYHSLTKPLKSFPNVTKSINLLKDFIKENFHPFILSASPHFYENAIRDWLYQNEIFTAGIFLKDVRQVFSLWDGDLTPKDITNQGLYKLNQLLDIITMTDIPDELILMGDNFESDPVIYLALSQMLQNQEDPWVIWKNLKAHKDFNLSKKQDAKFLSKIFQIKTLINNRKLKEKDFKIKIQIFIRKKLESEKIKIPQSMEQNKGLIENYVCEMKVTEKKKGSAEEKNKIDNPMT
jgi:hypothetical protein